MTFNKNPINPVAESDVKVSDWQAALTQVEEMGQQIQTQVMQLEYDLETQVFQGCSVDYAIGVTLNGNYRLIDLMIDRELLGDPDRLKNSLIEAYGSAHEHTRLYVQQRLALLQPSL